MENEKLIRKIAIEVIHRLTPLLGADGRRGSIVIVFTGATVSLNEAVRQVRLLLMDGYCCRLAFSDAAQQIYGDWICEQLDGYSHFRRLATDNWFMELKQAQFVVVPMLSVNTLSKISQLIADNLPTNLILHALFMGKPLVMAGDGADPAGKGRIDLGFTCGSPELARAIDQRLRTVESYGACVTDSDQLRNTVQEILEAGLRRTHLRRFSGHDRCQKRTATVHIKKTVTAADIRRAHWNRTQIRLDDGARVTPLAREMAQQYQVALLHEK